MSKLKYTYCAVVVLYNPSPIDLENIKLYNRFVEKVYVMDNSELNSFQIKKQVSTVENCFYTNMKGNKGLAFALSKACKMALSDGFDYILTMDQDSKLDRYVVDSLIEYVENSNEYSVLSPNVVPVFDKKNILLSGKKPYKYVIEDKNWVMTSGSMMCLKDYKEVGGFDESLFIEFIDIDLGIKFYMNNKKIAVVKNLKIYQRLGDSVPRRFLWKTIHPMNSSPIRTYYLVRNFFYILDKYGKFYKKFTHVSCVKIIVKILLYESNKLVKLVMVFRGYIDYKCKIMGEYKKISFKDFFS